MSPPLPDTISDTEQDRLNKSQKPSLAFPDPTRPKLITANLPIKREKVHLRAPSRLELNSLPLGIFRRCPFGWAA